jgi:hypothetical protein
MHCFWAGRESSTFGVWAAPAAPKNHFRRWGVSLPTFWNVLFGAAGAAQTLEIVDYRPAQKPCMKNPSVKLGETFLEGGNSNAVGAHLKNSHHFRRAPLVLNIRTTSMWHPSGALTSTPKTRNKGFDLILAVLKTIFNFDRGPPSPRGPGGGSELPFSSGDRRFWADSDPDPGGNVFLVFILAFSAVRL